MILVIDNYDSFTYNLVQYIRKLDCECVVHPSDEITIPAIRALAPKHIILSPGPGSPDQTGICQEAIRQFHSSIPILGVCLGHQTIAQVFGARIVKAPSPVHGKLSRIYHDGKSLFTGLPSPFMATRYHSLIVDKSSISDPLEVTAVTEEGLVMGIRHKQYPLEGVQFHPEALLTEYGLEMIRIFLSGNTRKEGEPYVRRNAPFAVSFHNSFGTEEVD